MQRKSLRPNTGTEARLPYLLTAVAGGFAMILVRNETQRHSAALKQVKALSAYSHSIVAGGLEVQSSTTRLIWRHSLVMRVEIVASTS